jgi:hypothetical protein
MNSELEFGIWNAGKAVSEFEIPDSNFEIPHSSFLIPNCR